MLQAPDLQHPSGVTPADEVSRPVRSQGRDEASTQIHLTAHAEDITLYCRDLEVWKRSGHCRPTVVIASLRTQLNTAYTVTYNTLLETVEQNYVREFSGDDVAVSVFQVKNHKFVDDSVWQLSNFGKRGGCQLKLSAWEDSLCDDSLHT